MTTPTIPRGLGLVLGPLLAALTATAASCGDPQLGPFGVTELCVTEARATCHFEYRCCNATERHALFPQEAPHADEPSCVDALVQSLCDEAGPHMDSVAAGRAAWDPGDAQACYGPLVDALDGCDAALVLDFQGNASCSRIVTGLVPDDGGCFASYECATAGATCQVPDVDPANPVVTSRGTCKPPVGAGEACLSRSCAPALHCDLARDACVPLEPDGEACSLDQDCQSGICAPHASPTTCSPPVPDGAACSAASQCQSGFCDALTSTCTTLEAARAEYDICVGST